MMQIYKFIYKSQNYYACLITWYVFLNINIIDFIKYRLRYKSNGIGNQ